MLANSNHMPSTDIIEPIEADPSKVRKAYMMLNEGRSFNEIRQFFDGQICAKADSIYRYGSIRDLQPESLEKKSILTEYPLYQHQPSSLPPPTPLHDTFSKEPALHSHESQRVAVAAAAHTQNESSPVRTPFLATLSQIARTLTALDIKDDEYAHSNHRLPAHNARKEILAAIDLYLITKLESPESANPETLHLLDPEGKQIILIRYLEWQGVLANIINGNHFELLPKLFFTMDLAQDYPNAKPILWFIMQLGNARALEIILDALTPVQRVQVLYQGDENHYSSLYFALTYFSSMPVIWAGNINTLFKCGYPVNDPNPHKETTPLRTAIELGEPELVQLLISKGGDVTLSYNTQLLTYGFGRLFGDKTKLKESLVAHHDSTLLLQALINFRVRKKQEDGLIVEHLIASGAPVYITSHAYYKNKISPFEYAVIFNLEYITAVMVTKNPFTSGPEFAALQQRITSMTIENAVTQVTGCNISALTFLLQNNIQLTSIAKANAKNVYDTINQTLTYYIEQSWPCNETVSTRYLNEQLERYFKTEAKSEKLHTAFLTLRTRFYAAQKQKQAQEIRLQQLDRESPEKTRLTSTDSAPSAFAFSHHGAYFM